MGRGGGASKYHKMLEVDIGCELGDKPGGTLKYSIATKTDSLVKINLVI
jgi:hypothetical protein